MKLLGVAQFAYVDCDGITHLNIRCARINLLFRVPDSLPTTCWIWTRPVELTSLLAHSCPHDFNNWQQFSNISFRKVFFCNSKSKRSQNHLWLRPSSCLLQQATFQATPQSTESLWVLSCCGFSNICVLCTERRSRHTRGSFWPEAFGSSRWSTSPQKEFFFTLSG